MQEQKENLLSPLELFRQEIREWRERELKNKEEMIEKGELGGYDPHAEEINPDHLTDDDRILWEKIKNKRISREDIEEHRKEFKSRSMFSAMATNKANQIIGERELNEET